MGTVTLQLSDKQLHQPIEQNLLFSSSSSWPFTRSLLVPNTLSVIPNLVEVLLFGNGNANPYGASSSGLGVANSYNGGFSSGSGQGFASGSPYGGYQSGGNGQAFSFGK